MYVCVYIDICIYVCPKSSHACVVYIHTYTYMMHASILAYTMHALSHTHTVEYWKTYACVAHGHYKTRGHTRVWCVSVHVVIDLRFMCMYV